MRMGYASMREEPLGIPLGAEVFEALHGIARKVSHRCGLEVNASGAIYAACDLVLDQRLSVLELETEDPEDFLRKAERLFGNFDVLGLAAVKDYFVRETKGYLVMEDLTQGSLRTAMEKSSCLRRTPDEMVKLFSPALEACVYLHSIGMIHGGDYGGSSAL